METKLFQEITDPIERESTLDANCLRPEDMVVKKHFSEKDMIDMRRDFADLKIAIRKEEERLAEIKKESDLRMKPIKESALYNETNIRMGFVEVKQQVYLFDDQESGMMGYYDNTGELIHSRRLDPVERQIRVKRDNAQA